MPKGVLWRQHEIDVAAIGGTPSEAPRHSSYEQVAAAASMSGALSVDDIPANAWAAQWGVFNPMTNGG